MLFRAYGLFWRVDEVDWFPGGGTGKPFRLLGRRGRSSPHLQIADFRRQHGIYILYGNFGPHYVGLARRQSLGARLKQHTRDEHAGKWDRFSWFGFLRVLPSRDERGLQKLGRAPLQRRASVDGMIADVEALLIKSMALRNKAQMSFAAATEWTQVKRDEVEKLMARLTP